MAWRIALQPNGKLARFSDIVDDFTHFDMSEEDARKMCESMGLGDYTRKINAAYENPERFDQEIETIRLIHGEDVAMLRRVELSITDAQRAAMKAEEMRRKTMLMRELTKSMREPDSFVVRFIYVGEDGKRFMRTVSPIRFEGRDRMLGYCLTRAEPRWFILDQIEKIIATVPANSVLMPCLMVEVEG